MVAISSYSFPPVDPASATNPISVAMLVDVLAGGARLGRGLTGS